MRNRILTRKVNFNVDEGTYETLIQLVGIASVRCKRNLSIAEVLRAWVTEYIEENKDLVADLESGQEVKVVGPSSGTD